MEEPSDSWLLTTEHTTAAGSRCSAEVSAGKMGSPRPHSSALQNLFSTFFTYWLRYYLHVNIFFS